MSEECDRKVSSEVRKAADLWCEDRRSTDDDSSEVTEYHASVVRKTVFLGVCAVIAIVVAGISLGQGNLEIKFLDCYKIVFNHILGKTGDAFVINGTTYPYSIVDVIVWQERLPRIVMGLAAGAGLAIGGCVMQSILKNPLADPYTTGISSGAGFGATLALTGTLTLMSGSSGFVLNAFIFALIPMAAIVSVSKFKGASPTTMIMAGIAVMYIFNAFTTVIKLNANPDDLASIYSWQIGSLNGIVWDDIPLVLGLVIVGGIVLQLLSRKLNVMSTGDDSAKAMGVNVEQLRIILLLLVSLVVAAIVSYTGLIGFIGLVAPHVARMFVGSDNRYLILSSAAFGAALLVVADYVGRSLLPDLAGFSLQVGVVTSFIGGPMFLYLILRNQKTGW